MKTDLKDNEKYDTRLEASDWRFSAAILGLIRYFKEIDPFKNFYEIKDDCVLYDSKQITKERYLGFVEKRYEEELHHVYIEEKIKKLKKIPHEVEEDKFLQDDIKSINEKLGGNTILKKVFKGVKFHGSNSEEILEIIKKNREDLILETFRNKKDMYANFCNTNQLLNKANDYSRLLGFYVDAGKKGKSTGYSFNSNSFVGQDIEEFDFIPFAFFGDRESFFINDNFEIKRILTSNETLKKKMYNDKADGEKYQGARYSLFKGIIETSDFIDYDVEVIIKNRDKDYFETLYIRKKSIDILKIIKKKKIDYIALCYSYKVNDNYYINVFNRVMDSILNHQVMDNIIELLLKNSSNSYRIKQLIEINILIRGEKQMDENTKKTIYSCAKEVTKIDENKVSSYRNKLINSMIAKDYDRVSEILLQLSAYSGVYFSFADELFMDFEENKDIIYVFINRLSNTKTKKEDKGE